MSKREDYGKNIVQTLSAQLPQEFGSGFSKGNLLRMMQSAELFPVSEIVATLSRQLSWSRFIVIEILRIHYLLSRQFCAQIHGNRGA